MKDQRPSTGLPGNARTFEQVQHDVGPKLIHRPGLLPRLERTSQVLDPCHPSSESVRFQANPVEVGGAIRHGFGHDAPILNR